MRRGSEEGKINSVKRRLFKLLSALSLVLCVAMMISWWYGQRMGATDGILLSRYGTVQSGVDLRDDRLMWDEGIITINRQHSYLYDVADPALYMREYVHTESRTRWESMDGGYPGCHLEGISVDDPKGTNLHLGRV